MSISFSVYLAFFFSKPDDRTRIVILSQSVQTYKERSINVGLCFQSGLYQFVELDQLIIMTSSIFHHILYIDLNFKQITIIHQLKNFYFYATELLTF